MAHSEKPAAAMAVRRRERRRAGRLAARVRVLIRTEYGNLPLLTENIDKRGMFLRTDTPRPVRDLVELIVEGGPEGPIEVVCVVRRSISVEEATAAGDVAGMAVQLYGVSGVKRLRWNRFVERIEQRVTAQSGSGSSRPGSPSDSASGAGSRRPVEPVQPAAAPPPSSPEPSGPIPFRFEASPTRPKAEAPGRQLPSTPPTSRAGETLRPVTPVNGVSRPPLFENVCGETGRVVTFNVSLPTREKLEAFLMRVMDNRPVALPSQRPLDVGERVRIDLVHPSSRETFGLPAQVSGNLSSRDGYPRVEVDFSEVPDSWLDSLAEFVRTGRDERSPEIEIPGS